MFLTRLGFGSKAVITGDITQMDLPIGRTSGLVEAMRVVAPIEGISFVYFDDADVVRHELVQQIVKAYAEYTSPHRRPATLGDQSGRRRDIIGMTAGDPDPRIVPPRRATATRLAVS